MNSLKLLNRTWTNKVLECAGITGSQECRDHYSVIPWFPSERLAAGINADQGLFHWSTPQPDVSRSTVGVRTVSVSSFSDAGSRGS
jgi:hypothetical protein